MQRHSLLFIVPLAAVWVLACSRSDAPKAPEAGAQKAAAEKTLRQAPTPAVEGVAGEGLTYKKLSAKPPKGFPLELMDGDKIVSSQFFTVGGVRSYDLQLHSKLPAEAIASYWKEELGKAGVVQVAETKIEKEGVRSFIQEGETADGMHGRVSVLENPPLEGEERPVIVSIFWGKKE